ncbi:MAG: NAD(+) diphosphatase [Thermodesulfobacteriota bacterium]
MKAPEAFCFAFRNHELLVKLTEEGDGIPRIKDIVSFNSKLMPNRYVGEFDKRPCFFMELSDDFVLPPGMLLTGLRGLFGRLPDGLFVLAGRSFQMILFEQRHRFCGGCGSPTEFKPDEYAKICPNCDLVRYPGVFPAIIVAVIKDRHILLARSQRFPKGRYSVLAGFVEPGETLEGCVRREIREEVGLEVNNIRYFGSQPWPFPNSLMIGFTAAYAGGEIAIDNQEILDAGWFAPSALPDVPARPTIARQLIDWFVNNSGLPPKELIIP